MFENYDIEFLFSSINVKLSAWTKCAVFVQYMCTANFIVELLSSTKYKL